MELFRKIFVCGSNNKKDQDKPSFKRGSTNQLPSIKKSVDCKEIAENIYSVVNRVKRTVNKTKLFFLPIEWWDKLMIFIDKGTKNTMPSKLIENKSIVKSTESVLVIQEILREILQYFDLDIVYYCKTDDFEKVSYDSNNYPKINLSSIKGMTVLQFCSSKSTKSNYFEDDDLEELKHTYTKVVIFHNEEEKRSSFDRPEKNDKTDKVEKIRVLNASANVKCPENNKMVIRNQSKSPIKNEDLNKSTAKSEIRGEKASGITTLPSETIGPNKIIVKVKSSINDTQIDNNINRTLNTTSNTKSIHNISFSSLKKIGMKPKGIFNPSVYCFMNSSMQCIVSIPELNYYFLNGDYEYVVKSTKNTALDALQEFLEYYKDSTGSFKPPSSLYSVCHSFLHPNRQHDCHEFFIKFLSRIQDEINGKPKYSLDKVKSASEAWTIYISKNHSIIDHCFAGLFKSSVKCHKCGYISGKPL